MNVAALPRDYTKVLAPIVAPFQPYQASKVAAVALACIALFAIQLQYAWVEAAAIALTCSGITLLSEVLRTHENSCNWFHFELNRWDAIEVAVRLILGAAVIAYITASLGIMPAQAVGALILQGDLRTIVLATIVAPVVEEIFFRGFLQERIEDLFFLTDRYLFTVTPTWRCILSVILTSCIFASVHIDEDQIPDFEEESDEVFNALFLGALWIATRKEVYQSLLAPIAIHAASNTAITLGLLAARPWLRV